jgi:hypothetical protein
MLYMSATLEMHGQRSFPNTNPSILSLAAPSAESVALPPFLFPLSATAEAEATSSFLFPESVALPPFLFPPLAASPVSSPKSVASSPLSVCDHHDHHAINMNVHSNDLPHLHHSNSHSVLHTCCAPACVWLWITVGAIFFTASITVAFVLDEDFFD